MILYFSGTGNSHWVAEFLTIRTGDEMYNMADVVTGSLSLRALKKNESLGFVFPVYGWRPPAVVRRVLDSLPDAYTPAYLYFVCTCGDDTGKTARVFSRWVQDKGWHCKAGFSVTMPNTYVCLPGFDVDPKPVESGKLDAAVRRMEDIVRKVADEYSGTDCHEGAFPRLKTYVLGWFFKHFLMGAAPFRSASGCIGCGKCQAVCPLHNVRMKNGRPEWGRHCAMCLACYHHCPKHAVAYGNRTRGKGQYVFPAIARKAVRE